MHDRSRINVGTYCLCEAQTTIDVGWTFNIFHPFTDCDSTVVTDSTFQVSLVRVVGLVGLDNSVHLHYSTLSSAPYNHTIPYALYTGQGCKLI